MVTTLTLHAGPDPGFDQPFEMLLACHQRIERTLTLLERLCAHLASGAHDDDARQAARDVMRYFDLAGPAHHEDEERHVFPALRKEARSETLSLVERLQQEHRAMAQQWIFLRADLQQVIDGGEPAVRADDMATRAAAFSHLYRDHIVAEETVAYPAARPLLDEATEVAMGKEMAARRGAYQRRPEPKDAGGSDESVK